MTTQFGEGFSGDGANAAHINTVLGAVGGPVETAWVTALATPSPGHAAFVVVAQPNLPVRPFTLFVAKSPVDPEQNQHHAQLTWGAAQAGVAGGVVDALREGVIDAADANNLLLIAAVRANPKADDAHAVYENNRAALYAALGAGRDGRPRASDVVAAGEPWNPFFGNESPTMLG